MKEKDVNLIFYSTGVGNDLKGVGDIYRQMLNIAYMVTLEGTYVNLGSFFSLVSSNNRIVVNQGQLEDIGDYREIMTESEMEKINSDVIVDKKRMEVGYGVKFCDSVKNKRFHSRIGRNDRISFDMDGLDSCKVDVDSDSLNLVFPIGKGDGPWFLDDLVRTFGQIAIPYDQKFAFKEKPQEDIFMRPMDIRAGLIDCILGNFGLGRYDLKKQKSKKREDVYRLVEPECLKSILAHENKLARKKYF